MSTQYNCRLEMTHTQSYVILSTFLFIVLNAYNQIRKSRVTLKLHLILIKCIDLFKTNTFPLLFKVLQFMNMYILFNLNNFDKAILPYTKYTI
jgi:hypothetical protein